MASSIINSDDGVVSGTSGLKTTGGDDGVTAFQQNGTERMRIDSSGNLLVGTTSTGVAAGGSGTSGININANGGIELARSANPVLFVNRTTSDGDIVQFRKDGTTVGSIGVASGPVGYMVFNNTATDNVAALKGASGAILPSTITGADKDGTMNLGSSGARFENLYLSGGVYVGGTGAANYLDDYEEGTFTPTYTGSSGGSFTASQALGYYTKVGNLVSWQVIINGNKNTLSGNISITGFPFSSSAETGAGASIAFCRNFATDMPNLRMYMQGGSSGLTLRKQATNATASTNVTSADMGTGVSDNYLYLSGQYLV